MHGNGKSIVREDRGEPLRGFEEGLIRNAWRNQYRKQIRATRMVPKETDQFMQRVRTLAAMPRSAIIRILGDKPAMAEQPA